jgi:hypothetical protein
MSVLIQDAFPKFNISMDFSEAETNFLKDSRNSFLAGNLRFGKFAKKCVVKIDAKTAASGVIKDVYNGEFNYSLAVALDSKDLIMMEDLCERLQAHGEEHNKDLFVEDQWTFNNPLKNSSTWYVKLKVQRGLFVPLVNGGKVTPEKCEGVIGAGSPLQITGTFGIWMNAASGQYGISFAAQTITF